MALSSFETGWFSLKTGTVVMWGPTDTGFWMGSEFIGYFFMNV